MSWNAVILAAGRGRRMGGPKAFMPFGDGTLLGAQLRALQGASQIAVVVAADLWEALSRTDIGAPYGKPLPQERESGLKPLPQERESGLKPLPQERESGLKPLLQERESGLKPLPQEQVILVPNPRVEEGPFISIQLGLTALGRDDPALIVPVDCPVAPDAPRLLLDAVTSEYAWAAPIHDDRKGHPVLLTADGRTAALASDAGPTLRDLMAATPGVLVPVDSAIIHCNLNTPADRDLFLAEHPSWPDASLGDSR